MKFKHTKFGLAADPRGAQVTIKYQGRTLLGDVVGLSYDEVAGCMRLEVNHFNGHPWPFRPTTYGVDVLEREYDTDIKGEDAP